MPTKSFVKIVITKIFCYNKIFSSINKTFGCCSEIFGCSNKINLFIVPNFVAVTKLFFSVQDGASLVPHSRLGDESFLEDVSSR